MSGRIVSCSANADGAGTGDADPAGAGDGDGAIVGPVTDTRTSDGVLPSVESEPCVGVPLVAPSQAGEYLLLLDVVTPTHGSLSTLGSTPSLVRVSVTGPTIAPSPSPAPAGSTSPVPAPSALAEHDTMRPLIVS